MSLDIDKVLDKASKCELLDELVIKVLCDRVIDLMEQESNVKPVQAPVTVVGDIHGQFYDVIEIFRIRGGKFSVI